MPANEARIQIVNSFVGALGDERDCLHSFLMIIQHTQSSSLKPHNFLGALRLNSVSGRVKAIAETYCVGWGARLGTSFRSQSYKLLEGDMLTSNRFIYYSGIVNVICN